jgi:hypothetical protein
VTNAKNRSLPDLLPREWALMVPTIAIAIVMGVVPNLFLRPMEPSVKKTIERVTGRSYAQNLAIRESQLAVRKGAESPTVAATLLQKRTDSVAGISRRAANHDVRTATSEPRTAKANSNE